MKALKVFRVDAFTNQPFHGNPAAVCPLDTWLPDSLMQQIAAENNLAETAFYVPAGVDEYEIRWFTPVAEVPLCGHATIAAAYVIYNHEEAFQTRADAEEQETQNRILRFSSQSGPLEVVRQEGRLVLDFPAQKLMTYDQAPEFIEQALGTKPINTVSAMYWLAEFDSEETIRNFEPDYGIIERATELIGLIVTAPGSESGTDFVSRFFAPRVGIDEDPVTGSAHTLLIPYWAAKTGKDKLFARQISPRGGSLWCEMKGERVKIGGEAVLTLEGIMKL